MVDNTKNQEKIEYYKAKIEKRKCDLERDNTCLNNQLIALVTFFGSIILIFISFLQKVNLDIILDLSLLILFFFLALVVDFFLIYLLISRKVSKDSDSLNKHFEQDIIKVGELAMVPRIELDNYKLYKI